MILTSSDVLRLVTGASATVDVFASYVDVDSSGNATPGNNGGVAITIAATTTIVSSPAAGSTRKVKAIIISNRVTSSLAGVALTVEFYDGAATQLVQRGLGPGAALIYGGFGRWSTIESSLVSHEFITTPGASSYTPADGARAILVEGIAGGGAGGGCIDAATNSAGGGGGGAGGYDFTILLNTLAYDNGGGPWGGFPMWPSFYVFIGSGGAGVSAADGGNGTDTIFADPSASVYYVQSLGGKGGKVDTVNTIHVGGLGGEGGLSVAGIGAPSGSQGQSGAAGLALAAAQALGGRGGSRPPWGGGGAERKTQGNGNNAVGYGAGGGGGCILSSGGDVKGGDGSQGLALVTVFR